MDTKDLSPAFITSLVGIFIGAILIGLESSVATIFGWLLLLAGLALNVFSSLISIQRLKGGPLPSMISEAHEETDEHNERAATAEHELFDDSQPDTEAQYIVPAEEKKKTSADDEKIFRPRARTR